MVGSPFRAAPWLRIPSKNFFEKFSDSASQKSIFCIVVYVEKNDGSVATAGKTADSRERPAIRGASGDRIMVRRAVCTNSKKNTKNFLQKSFSRFNSAAPQIPPTKYARCSSTGRARIMRADKFAHSKFLLDL